jgi:Ser/Thr protein kinase RdoA (MazF antagonist)
MSWLTAAAALLRRYHDAVSGSQLAAGEEVVCHGDFGPWNLIWRDGLPQFVIDFDNAGPGPRLQDIGYAIWKFEVERTPQAFLEGYGTSVDPSEAIAYAKARERERFERNGWTVDF